MYQWEKLRVGGENGKRKLDISRQIKFYFTIKF